MQVLLQVVIFNRGSHTCCKPCKLILTIVYDAGPAGYTLSLFAGEGSGSREPILNHTWLEGMGLEDCCGGIILRSLALPLSICMTTYVKNANYLYYFLSRDWNVMYYYQFCVSTWNKFLEMRFWNIFHRRSIDIYRYSMFFFAIRFHFLQVKSINVD